MLILTKDGYPVMIFALGTDADAIHEFAADHAISGGLDYDAASGEAYRRGTFGTIRVQYDIVETPVFSK